jgi:hypothetical protein
VEMSERENEIEEREEEEEEEFRRKWVAID